MRLHLALIFLCSLVLNGISIGAEQPTQIEPPQRAPVSPKKPAKPRNPREEREKKEKAAAEEAARKKAEQDAQELKYRREYDQKQIDIQNRIAEFTGSLVTIGYLQVGVAVIGLSGIIAAWIAGRAAKASAEAARSSAETAKSALRADRPYLLIRNVNFQPIELMEFPSKIYMRIGMEFKNFGKGPALIDDFVAKLLVVPTGQVPPTRDYGQCRPVINKSDAIAADEQQVFIGDMNDLLIDREYFTAVQQPSSKLAFLYGRIKYRDVFDGPCETGFCWKLITPPPGVADPGVFVRYEIPGVDVSNNYHT